MALNPVPAANLPLGCVRGGSWLRLSSFIVNVPT